MELLAGAEAPAQESEPWANTHRQEHLRDQAAEGQWQWVKPDLPG